MMTVTYVAGKIGPNFYKASNELVPFLQLNNDKSPEKPIESVCCGNGYNIYKNDNNIFVIGTNENGQLGLLSSIVMKQCVLMDYFKKNNIEIHAICVNPTGHSSFWISDKNTVYGCGRNESYQLGLGHRNKVYRPELIACLSDKNVIDIKSACLYSVALCRSDDTIPSIIAHFWSRTQNINIPNDIVTIITNFGRVHAVYSTTTSLYGGDGHCNNYWLSTETDIIANKWGEIEQLKDKDIIEIGTGSYFSLFLESNGNLWSCGKNDDGQCGVGLIGDDITKPTLIDYFVENKIKIKNISVGAYHCLVIDFNGNIYSFGYGDYGALGHENVEDVSSPKLIMFFKQYDIVSIGTGFAHSHVMTSGHKHFLFGSNQYNECLTFNDEKKVTEPFCVNQTIKNIINGSIIKMFLGYYNTNIIINVTQNK